MNLPHEPSPGGTGLTCGSGVIFYITGDFCFQVDQPGRCFSPSSSEKTAGKLLVFPPSQQTQPLSEFHSGDFLQKRRGGGG